MTVALQNIETDLLLASWTQIGENCKVEWAEVKIKRWSWCSPWGVLLHKWANQCRPNLHYSVSGKIPSLLWKWPQLCRFYQILRNPCREWMRCTLSQKNWKNVARQLHPMGHLDTSVRCTHNSPFKLIAAHLSLVYQIFSFPLFIRFSFFPCIWDFYLSLFIPDFYLSLVYEGLKA